MDIYRMRERIWASYSTEKYHSTTITTAGIMMITRLSC